MKRCPIYAAWKDMLRRTVSDGKGVGSLATYADCSTIDEWFLFSNFLSWAEDKFQEGYHLDKDIILQGNTVYSPGTCVFIPRWLNDLFKPNSIKTSLPMGVRTKYSSSGRLFYEAYSKFDKEWLYLGLFGDQCLAHRAWQENRVDSLTTCINKLQRINFTDERVIDALHDRIFKLKEDISQSKVTEAL